MSNSSAGKGDKSRPRYCSYEEWSKRWDEAFNKTKKRKTLKNKKQAV